jgi:hypothetical protein
MLNSCVKSHGSPLSSENHVIEATLTKAVTFNYINGLSVLLPIGTEITVDTEQLIGSFESYNFDLSSDEFQEVQESIISPKVALAILTKHISFQHPVRGELFFQAGSELYVDLKEKVGIVSDCAFDIESDEFFLL